ncbi:MAG: flagellar hook-associated protein 2, partial [Halothiobacillaceae bacterium]
MPSITSLGIGSGIDVEGLVKQLMEAERAPTAKRLDVREVDLQAKISSFGSLKGALSSFKTTLGSLRSASSVNGKTVSVSDNSVLTATIAGSNATEGSYTLQVDKLAQAHAIASTSFSDIKDVIGTGTLTFAFGTTTFDGEGLYTGFSEN